MKKLLVSVSFLFLVASCARAPIVDETDYAGIPTEERSTCDLLQTASWHDTNLYDLTYGCVPKGWENFFSRDDVKEQVRYISDSLKNEIKDIYDISPPIGKTFRALYMVPPHEIKSIIMGQDPAPQPGLAVGLSFSLTPGVSTSEVASVQRVFLEVQNEKFCVDLGNGDLSRWAEEGVLLLNMALTIPCPTKGEYCTIAAHLELWKEFSKELMEYIDELNQPMAIILWGSKAKQYDRYVHNKMHKALEGGHPSPKASPYKFFCLNYFNCADKWLSEQGHESVNWNLIDHCNPSESCYWDWDSKTRTSNCIKKCTLKECD